MSAAPPRSRRRRVAGLVAGLLILAFLLVGVVTAWDRVSAYEWRLEPVALAAGLAILVMFYAASGAGFVLILERLAGVRLRRTHFLAVWGRSLLGRYVPGNVLMVASRLVLAQEAGISRRVTFAATVYEQALTLGVAGAGGAVLLVVYGIEGGGAELWVAALVPLGLALLHPRAFGPLTTRVLVRLGREPLAVLLTPRQLAAMVGWYGIAAALLAVGIWLVVRGTAGPEAGSLPYVGLSFLLSFVLSMLAFVFPSGLGVREGVFALALARDLPGAVAIAVSALVRLGLTAAELLFVGAAVVAARARRSPGR